MTTIFKDLREKNMKCGQIHESSNYGRSCEDDLWRSYSTFFNLHRFVWKGSIFLNDFLSQDRAEVSAEDFQLSLLFFR